MTNATLKITLVATLGFFAACTQSPVASTEAVQKNRRPAETEIIQAALPPVAATETQQEKIWESYCLGTRNSTDIPQPNYSNEEVIEAAKKLAMIYPQSYYFYSGPLYIYELRTGKELNNPSKKFPAMSEVKNGKENANAFLTLLCGEFRDRPTLIKEKIKWVNKIHKLPVAKQTKMKMQDHVWSKMTAQSYQDYIAFSEHIYGLKKDNAEAAQVEMGTYYEPAPVEPYTVCETKFMFQKYIIPQKTDEVESLMEYQKAYNKFKGKCNPEDLAYLYDFRGDSNFKPNSPESNGMIWYSSAIANSCIRVNGKLVIKDKLKSKFTNQNICEDYYRAPFAHRWTAARAGLATWLFNSKSTDTIFSNAKSTVNVTANYDKLNTAFDYVMPDMETTDKVLAAWSENKSQFWSQPDLGFNKITGLGTNHVDRGFAFERLRNAVNRHTDWYKSGYNDLISEEIKKEAYSPFVASSFDMAASDEFTSPGVTVKSPADGCKHWMFVFKIKKDQWYSTQHIAEGKKVNFNENWFDETSLGTNRLANSERALDRLGTALEGELDSIMYLNNLTKQGEPKDKCGDGFVK